MNRDEINALQNAREETIKARLRPVMQQLMQELAPGCDRDNGLSGDTEIAYATFLLLIELGVAVRDGKEEHWLSFLGEALNESIYWYTKDWDTLTT